jgi:hypothetical protein
MQRVAKITLIVCIGSATVLSMLFLLRPRQIEYEGRTLTKWLLLVDEGPISSDGDPNAYAEQDRAVEVVRILGTNCVPTLVSLIQARDSKAKNFLTGLLSKQSVFSFYFPKSKRLNTAGVRGFQILGTNAYCAVPLLLQTLETGDKQQRDYASLALKYAGYTKVTAERKTNAGSYED